MVTQYIENIWLSAMHKCIQLTNHIICVVAITVDIAMSWPLGLSTIVYTST